MSGPGHLVLVVGPSGAGKDSIMSGARERITDARLVFARRIITRPSVLALEDHDSMKLADFEAAEAAGAFLLSWRAHGLAYGIPSDYRAHLAQGGVLVANVSRSVVPLAEALPTPTTVVHITAPDAVLDARLRARGRESAGDVAARVAREARLDIGRSQMIAIVNDSTLESAVARFAEVLHTSLRQASDSAR